MIKRKTFSESVFQYNEWLANMSFDLFGNYSIRNPFQGKNKEQVKKITKAFYKKYYNV